MPTSSILSDILLGRSTSKFYQHLHALVPRVTAFHRPSPRECSRRRGKEGKADITMRTLRVVFVNFPAQLTRNLTEIYLSNITFRGDLFFTRATSAVIHPLYLPPNIARKYIPIAEKRLFTNLPRHVVDTPLPFHPRAAKGREKGFSSSFASVVVVDPEGERERTMYKFGHPCKVGGSGDKGESTSGNIDFESIDKRELVEVDPCSGPCQPLIERKPAINITFLSRGRFYNGSRSRQRKRMCNQCDVCLPCAPSRIYTPCRPPPLPNVRFNSNTNGGLARNSLSLSLILWEMF